jgi:hypothetical protein
MITVIRFLSRSVPRDEMLAIGEAMNAVRPGVFTDLRPRGDGFSCSVCDDPAWSVQVRAIRDFITELGACIHRARSAGLSVTIDILIETEDLASAAVKVFAFDPDLLSALGSAGIRLEISSYE